MKESPTSEAWEGDDGRLMVSLPGVLLAKSPRRPSWRIVPPGTWSVAELLNEFSLIKDSVRSTALIQEASAALKSLNQASLDYIKTK
jgi:hypothetical protein